MRNMKSVGQLLAMACAASGVATLVSACSTEAHHQRDDASGGSAGEVAGSNNVPRSNAGAAGQAPSNGTGGSSNGTGGSTSITTLVTLVGTVSAPNGTGIAQASVDVFTGSETSGKPAASTTSKADGSFSVQVQTGGATSGTLVTTKGNWRKQSSISFGNGGTITVPKSATQFDATEAGAPRIAVVTGSFDRMEDVLAKYGLGELDEGFLALGTEKFTLIDGDGTLGFPYQTSDMLFSQVAELAKYDMILINCGADETPLVVPAQRANIKAWVEQGGTLYATDLAYDFVEQLFPSAVAFYAGNLSAIPEEVDVAQVGDPDIEVQAAISDEELLAWASAEPGVLTGDKLPVGGFLDGWAVIDSVAASTRVLVRGEVSFNFGEGIADKPLTISFSALKGKVIYSSYHTHHELSETSLIPQEKVLGYLLF